VKMYVDDELYWDCIDFDYDYRNALKTHLFTISHTYILSKMQGCYFLEVGICLLHPHKHLVFVFDGLEWSCFFGKIALSRASTRERIAKQDYNSS
jgi:hypothetical protein